VSETHDHVVISVEQGDVGTFKADVLALKYAQGLHGVDAAVARRLLRAGVDVAHRLPCQSESLLVDSQGAIGASSVIFVGVEPLHKFTYSQIRQFSRDALIAIKKSRPDVKHVLLTLHGAGYGLDVIEAFNSEIAGIVDAVTSGDAPPSLQQVSIVESDPRCVQKLQHALKQIIPDAKIPVPTASADEPLSPTLQAHLDTVGHKSDNRPSVFVAMPFSEQMDDVFHFGISGPVKAAGFLCERADFSTFTGDAMAWVRERISTATLVIAEVTGANPNVYLEVGYAWGCGTPTLLLAQGQSDLKFDIQGQRCIIYNKKIKDLEESLRKYLEVFSSQRR